MSVRQDIIGAILTRVQGIKVEDGYQTDAGRTVFVGETPQLGPDDPPEAVAVVIHDEISTETGGFGAGREMPTLCILPIDVQGIAKADLEQPWMTVEAIVADIKTAMETEDAGLGGLLTKTFGRGRIRTVPREPGATIVGAGMEYRFTFAESWGGGQA